MLILITDLGISLSYFGTEDGEDGTEIKEAIEGFIKEILDGSDGFEASTYQVVILFVEIFIIISGLNRIYI